MGDYIVLIRGAGDLGSGVAHRLYRAGFNVVMTELPEPRAVRRMTAFSNCVPGGRCTIEGVDAMRVESVDQAMGLLRKAPGVLMGISPLAGANRLKAGTAVIPVIVDAQSGVLPRLSPLVLVDARMAKRNLGTRMSDAPIVVAVGPGFTAGIDAHAVVETARGHYLGRVIYHGRAQEFTGEPGEVGGFTVERLLRAPMDGSLRTVASIADRVAAGQVLAEVVAAGEHVPIKAAIPGVLRGLLRDGAPVSKGQKIGDVDPRCDPEAVWHISDKARAVGGGVLEAIMCLLWGRPSVDPASVTKAGGCGEVGREPK